MARILPRIGAIATVGVCLSLLGCNDAKHSSRHSTAAHRKPRAWFDAKGFCVFPLVTDSLPTTRQQLSDALDAGWRKNLKFKDEDAQIVSAAGRVPTLSSLKFDLAGGRMDLTKDNKNTKPSGKVEGQFDVGQFDLQGDPLLCDRGKMKLSLTASHARLDYEHDEGGRPVLMLADAKHARLDFQITPADLERVVLVSTRAAAGKYGVKVDSVNIKLDASTRRSLTLDLHLATHVGFIPAGMRFQAHVDIDNAMNAKLTHLQCDGDEALGPLIVNIIRPGLAKYENRSKPVFSFPTGELELKDVQIQTADQIQITALFGSPGADKPEPAAKKVVTLGTPKSGK
ncbi:MAG TPA: hypothetical protein VH370_15675 [Humisphaera sp.]|jgi:hypothetical protein|nr:hypothetical protein [Humisphaera sp.]